MVINDLLSKNFWESAFRITFNVPTRGTEVEDTEFPDAKPGSRRTFWAMEFVKKETWSQQNEDGRMGRLKLQYSLQQVRLKLMQ